MPSFRPVLLFVATCLPVCQPFLRVEWQDCWSSAAEVMPRLFSNNAWLVVKIPIGSLRCWESEGKVVVVVVVVVVFVVVVVVVASTSVSNDCAVWILFTNGHFCWMWCSWYLYCNAALANSSWVHTVSRTEFHCVHFEIMEYARVNNLSRISNNVF